MAISMLKIRRPLGRLIFNMGIAIPGKTVFLIETAPWQQAIIWTNVDPDLYYDMASPSNNGLKDVKWMKKQSFMQFSASVYQYIITLENSWYVPM